MMRMWRSFSNSLNKNTINPQFLRARLILKALQPRKKLLAVTWSLRQASSSLGAQFGSPRFFR